MSHLSPVKQDYANKVNELYKVHKPHLVGNGMAEKVVARWSDGGEERAYQTLLHKYSHHSPSASPSRHLSPHTAALVATPTASPSRVYASPHQSPRGSPVPFQSLSPTKQQYVTRVNDIYAAHKPHLSYNGNAEKVVATWPDGQEEQRFQLFNSKYLSRPATPARSTTVTAPVQPHQFQPATHHSSPALQQSSTTVLSPQKQVYAQKLNELYATYKPERANNGNAEKVVASWADGSEELAIQSLAHKYTSRAPSPARVRPEPVQAFVHASPTSLNSSFHVTPTRSLHASPSQVPPSWPTNDPELKRQHYVQKVKELYAAYKPELANDRDAGILVDSWQPAGMEESRYQSMLKKYSSRAPSPMRTADLAVQPAGDGSLQLSPTLSALSPHRSPTNHQSLNASFSHGDAVKQDYARKVNELYATYKPERANNGNAEKIVNSWAPGTEERAYQILLRKYAGSPPAPTGSGSVVVQPAADGSLQLSPTLSRHNTPPLSPRSPVFYPEGNLQQQHHQVQQPPPHITARSGSTGSTMSEQDEKIRKMEEILNAQSQRLTELETTQSTLSQAPPFYQPDMKKEHQSLQRTEEGRRADIKAAHAEKMYDFAAGFNRGVRMMEREAKDAEKYRTRYAETVLETNNKSTNIDPTLLYKNVTRVVPVQQQQQQPNRNHHHHQQQQQQNDSFDRFIMQDPPSPPYPRVELNNSTTTKGGLTVHKPVAVAVKNPSIIRSQQGVIPHNPTTPTPSPHRSTINTSSHHSTPPTASHDPLSLSQVGPSNQSIWGSSQQQQQSSAPPPLAKTTTVTGGNEAVVSVTRTDHFVVPPHSATQQGSSRSGSLLLGGSFGGGSPPADRSGSTLTETKVEVALPASQQAPPSTVMVTYTQPDGTTTTAVVNDAASPHRPAPATFRPLQSISNSTSSARSPSHQSVTVQHPPHKSQRTHLSPSHVEASASPSSPATAFTLPSSYVTTTHQVGSPIRGAVAAPPKQVKVTSGAPPPSQKIKKGFYSVFSK